MKKIFLIIILGALASCSSIKPLHRPIKDSGSNGVDVEFENKNAKKDSDKTVVEIKKPEESIRIGEKGGEVYSEPTDTDVAHQEKRMLKIGIALGPGLNRSINYISVLKGLEKNNLSPYVITGTEMGAVIASLYAAGITPEMIEWMFFKYFKDKKNYKPFEKDWISEIDTYFLQKIKNVKLEETKIKLYLTLLDHNTKKTYYFDKGNIRDLVLLNLRLANNPLRYKTGQAYSGAFEKEVFNARLMNSVGSEFSIAVDSLGNKFDFENPNEFLVGVLGKVSARSNLEKKNFDYVINIPDQRMKLDSSTDGINFLQLTSDYMNGQNINIKKKIQVKIEEITNQNIKE